MERATTGHNFGKVPVFPPAGEPAADMGPLAERIRRSLGGGEAPQTRVRYQLQAVLGTELSRVRIHNDTEADRLTRAVDTAGFTSGNDVFFRAGMYQLHTRTGKQLLAHEASHIVQQARGPVEGRLVIGNVLVSDPGDRFERAAQSSAAEIADRGPVVPGHRAARGRSALSPLPLQHGYPIVVQRDVWKWAKSALRSCFGGRGETEPEEEAQRREVGAAAPVNSTTSGVVELRPVTSLRARKGKEPSRLPVAPSPAATLAVPAATSSPSSVSVPTTVAPQQKYGMPAGVTDQETAQQIYLERVRQAREEARHYLVAENADANTILNLLAEARRRIAREFRTERAEEFGKPRTASHEETPIRGPYGKYGVKTFEAIAEGKMEGGAFERGRGLYYQSRGTIEVPGGAPQTLGLTGTEIYG